MSLSNVISPTAQGLEPRLLHLLQTHLDTFIKWDIVRHFHEQPHLTHTAAQLARVLGRDERVIVPELLQLTRTGLLNAEEMADTRVFTYTDNLDTRALVADFFSACQDRRFRVQAICHVIRGLR
jgi:hypothetical protein